MPSLTVTGGVIFDADRALGVQGDGRTADSSASIWEPTTNLENSAGADVSFESGTAGYTTGGTNTIASSAEQFKFGAKSCKATYQDNATLLDIALTLTAAAQSASRWLYIPAAYDGGGVSVQFANYAGATGTLAVAANMALRDQWQRVEVPNVVVAGGDLIGNVQVVNTGAAPTAGRFVYIDGCQTETQPLCTPFTISPRTAARVQAPVANTDGTEKFTETTGAVLIYWRSGWSSTDSLGGTRFPEFLQWADSGTDNFDLFYDPSTDKFNCYRRAAGAGAVLLSAVQSFARDDLKMALFKWTATQIGLGLDGAACVTQANTTIPTLAATSFDLGSKTTRPPNQEIDSDLKFAATFDSGDISDSEWAALYARVQQGDCAPEDLSALCANANCTATFPFDTAAYLDEAFTIIDPKGDGTSKNLLPHLKVEIDFTNNPTNATRVWTDVTTDVRDLSYVRGGRNHELQRTEAGTLNGVFNNRHGRYDSTNAASPHYPGVKRMRWMRVRSRWGVTDYARWIGLIESWQQEWPNSGKDAIVHIQATDTFKVLNLYDLSGLSYGAQGTGARVSAVLTSASVTAGTVDTGQSSIVASGTFAEGSFALPHLLEVEESENGCLFAEGDGGITFQNRHYRLLNSATSVATIGENAGEIPYREARANLDDADIYNSVSVTPSGGTPEVATDTTSQGAHYTRRLARTILVSSQAEALSAAQYLVGRYADPSQRIPEVALLGVRDTTKWPTILAAKNSQRFTFKRRAAATISQDVFVERVADRVVPGTAWDVRLQLSPADDQAGWVLGDATYSLLGETTVLTY